MKHLSLMRLYVFFLFSTLKNFLDNYSQFVICESEFVSKVLVMITYQNKIQNNRQKTVYPETKCIWRFISR